MIFYIQFQDETSIILTVHFTQQLDKDAVPCNDDPDYIMRDCLDSYVGIFINYHNP